MHLLLGDKPGAGHGCETSIRTPITRGSGGLLGHPSLLDRVDGVCYGLCIVERLVLEVAAQDSAQAAADSMGRGDGPVGRVGRGLSRAIPAAGAVTSGYTVLIALEECAIECPERPCESSGSEDN